jgi:hypothetical protein
VPLSALEHYAYCHRQTALIHVERIWTDSGDAVRGDLSHRTVDLPGQVRRTGVTVVRSLPVWSEAHGLRGICDLVEIDGDTAAPVEYKVGRHMTGGPAELQVSGPAICLIEIAALQATIKQDQDSIRIYRLPATALNHVEHLGRPREVEPRGPFVI